MDYLPGDLVPRGVRRRAGDAFRRLHVGMTQEGVGKSSGFVRGQYEMVVSLKKRCALSHIHDRLHASDVLITQDNTASRLCSAWAPKDRNRTLA